VRVRRWREACHAIGRGRDVKPPSQPFSPRGREQVGAPYCPHLLCPPLPPRGRGGLWSAEAKLPPTLKCAMRAHCRAPLHPSPTPRTRGWG
jgi:hypothetical protein